MSNTDDLPAEPTSSATPESSQKREFKGRDIVYPLIAIIAGLVLGYLIWGGDSDSEQVGNNQQLENQISQLQSEIDSKNERIAGLEQELSDKTAEIERLTAELAEKEEQISNLQQELVALNERITQLEEAVPPEVGELVQLQNDLVAKSEEIDELQREIAELNSEIYEKNNQLADFEEIIANLNEEVTDLKNQIATKDNRINELESTVTDLNEQISTLNKEIADLQEQLRQANLPDSEQLSLLKEEIEQLKRELAQLEQESSDKSDEIARLNIEIRKLENKLAGQIPGISLPSFINIIGEEEIWFEIGEATLTEQFKRQLIDEVADQIRSHAEEFGATIVEVIGHTDDLPIVREYSNFDNEILDAYNGSFPVDELKPADNAGLGIARAVSVIKELEKIDSLSNLTFVPLSGGQLILPNDGNLSGNVSGDVRERRRIEIRVRRSTDSNYVGN